MGGRLVTQFVDLAMLGAFPNMAHASRYTLVAMASIARDEDKRDVPRAIYYGGWEMLAKTLGYPEYTAGAHRAVARAIAELLEAGLIKPEGQAGRGGRQAYRITLPEVFGKEGPE